MISRDREDLSSDEDNEFSHYYDWEEQYFWTGDVPQWVLGEDDDYDDESWSAPPPRQWARNAASADASDSLAATHSGSHSSSLARAQQSISDDMAGEAGGEDHDDEHGRSSRGTQTPIG